MTDQTRGELSNNPGNINYGGGWIGEIGLEIVPPDHHYPARFARFDTAEHGIRAIGKQLRVYQTNHDLRTIRGMINRWAPPSDNNDTSAYVRNVCAACGVGPDDDYPLLAGTDDLARMIPMVRAIIVQENGRCIYGEPTINAACRDALGLPPAV